MSLCQVSCSSWDCPKAGEALRVAPSARPAGMLLTVPSPAFFTPRWRAGCLLCCPPSPPFCTIRPWGLLRCFGEVWQLQVWCEQRDSSLVSPHKQSMPASCAVLHVTDPQNCRRLRTRNRCRTGSKGTWDKTSVFVSPKGQQSSHLLTIILWRAEQCLYGKMTGGKISGNRVTFVS